MISEEAFAPSYASGGKINPASSLALVAPSVMEPGPLLLTIKSLCLKPQIWLY